MDYLKDKVVYLCGTIHGDSDDGTGWRDEITPKLNKMGIHVLNPCKKVNSEFGEVGEDKRRFKKMVMGEDWDLLKREFWNIVRYDLRCVDKSDFLILYHDPTIPTVGTIHELVIATFEKKVILLKYDKSQLDSFNPWMATFIKSHHFFPEWDLMFDYLKDVNQGILDTSYWVL